MLSVECWVLRCFLSCELYPVNFNIIRLYACVGVFFLVVSVVLAVSKLVRGDYL